MLRLSLYDWELVLLSDSTEGYCWQMDKRIEVGMLCGNPRELLIHEVAHIGTARFCNQTHNPVFWKTFADYMRRFLPTVTISDSQREHAKYSTVGIYGIQYRRDI